MESGQTDKLNELRFLQSTYEWQTRLLSLKNGKLVIQAIWMNNKKSHCVFFHFQFFNKNVAIAFV